MTSGNFFDQRSMVALELTHHQNVGHGDSAIEGGSSKMPTDDIGL
jgi:hypothetical protein